MSKNDKTCGECKYYNDAMFHCEKFDCMSEDGWSCPDCEEKEKPKPTNGDVIRRGGDKALLAYRSNAACYCCSFRDTESCKSDFSNCKDGQIAWLNSPAESEGGGEDE
jgi:hypothetical protein